MTTAHHRVPRGPTTVVQVFGSLDRGGAELRTLDIAGRVPAEDVHLIYVCLSGRPGELAPRAVESGSEVIPMTLGLLFPVRFVAMLRRSNADAVHSHVATFSGVVLALARVAAVGRRICHFRSDGDGRGSNPYHRARRALFRFLVDRSATDIIGVSPGALTHGWRYGWAADRRCAVIPNGLDLDLLPHGEEARARVRDEVGIPGDALLVAFVGKSSPAKAVDRALAVLRVLLARRHDVHVLVVGRYADADRAAIRDLTPASRVHALGSRDDVPHLLHAADVTLLTSRREGLPGVVLESLAVGTPVVASDLPGTRWIAEQTAGVQLVAPHGDEEDWAAAVSVATSARETTRRTVVRAEFARSPFRLSRAVEHVSALWTPVD